ncbi:class I SAM-dependent methyltransferase [filamentous cyanobacterium CCP5]|nr:class I SAM-dependent methyltransferase [filamentous cyanobacterium CCP5]
MPSGIPMARSHPLSRAAAKDYYDRWGLRQDHQHYEDRAVERLFQQLHLEQANGVVELGCGTGRWAQVLLAEHLPGTGTYWGGDISDTMVATAKARLHPFGDRAVVEQIDGDMPLPLAAGSCDRFFSTYVLDLLPEAEIEQCIGEARRLLVPGGWLGLAGITPGTTPASKLVMQGWQWLHLLKPEWLGGCRPLRLEPWLSPADWAIEFRTVESANGIASEVLVARRRPLPD